MRIDRRRGWAASTALLLSACSLAPDRPMPASPAPEHFSTIPAGWSEAAPADAAPRGDWWLAFGDPTLNDLEARAERASPTLAAALARRDEAMAALGQARAAQLPEIDAAASGERQRESANRPLAPNGAATFNDWRVGAGASYELDLWGRVRNSVRAARAEAAASDADLASARLSLQAAVADAWVRLRGLDAEADLLQRSVETYARALELTRVRHEGGVASGLDENRARTVLGNARAQAADIAAQRATTEHELAALTGETAGAFHIAAQAGEAPAPAIPTGTPSALLQRRPDVAAAERRVAEANARIGVARAALFPTITLGASGGFETTGAPLLSTPSSFWGLGPIGLSLPLFDAGRRQAGVRLSRAQYDEATAAYRGTVLTAFREVEDALANAALLAREAQDQRAAAEAAEATSRLAFTRYREGAADYFEVVTAQTDALNARRALIALETRRAQASVALVRALGGPAT